MDFNNEFDNFKKNARDTFNDHKDEAMRYAKRETRKHLDDFLGDDEVSSYDENKRDSSNYEAKHKNDYHPSSSYSYNEEKSLNDNDYYVDKHSYNNSNNHQTESKYSNEDDYNRDDTYYNNDENYHNYREHEDEDY